MPTETVAFDDDVPDCVVLPIPEGKLDGRWVSVRSNYAPAPEHEQVRVTYTFTQDGAAIHETTIEATLTLQGLAPRIKLSGRTAELLGPLPF
jgi:hypothetical protein